MFLTPGKASIKPDGGDAKELNPKAWDVIWTDAVRHTVMNLGTAPVEALSVELRPKGK